VPAFRPFLTGNSVTFEAGNSGDLYFTINDDASGADYSDNSGRLDVQLTVVPEPTTMIAGALLLLPFGASTLRILRKTRTA
jgi:hypothetical protein